MPQSWKLGTRKRFHGAGRLGTRLRLAVFERKGLPIGKSTPPSVGRLCLGGPTRSPRWGRFLLASTGPWE